MQVGDLVRVPHGSAHDGSADGPNGYIGVVVSTDRVATVGIVSVFGTFGWEVDVFKRDLEILNEGR